MCGPILRLARVGRLPSSRLPSAPLPPGHDGPIRTGVCRPEPSLPGRNLAFLASSWSRMFPDPARFLAEGMPSLVVSAAPLLCPFFRPLSVPPVPRSSTSSSTSSLPLRAPARRGGCRGRPRWPAPAPARVGMRWRRRPGGRTRGAQRRAGRGPWPSRAPAPPPCPRPPAGERARAMRKCVGWSVARACA